MMSDPRPSALSGLVAGLDQRPRLLVCNLRQTYSASPMSLHREPAASAESGATGILRFRAFFKVLLVKSAVPTPRKGLVTAS